MAARYVLTKIKNGKWVYLGADDLPRYGYSHVITETAADALYFREGEKPHPSYDDVLGGNWLLVPKKGADKRPLPRAPRAPRQKKKPAAPRPRMIMERIGGELHISIVHPKRKKT